MWRKVSSDCPQQTSKQISKPHRSLQTGHQRWIASSVLLLFGVSLPVQAQIIPDTTLGNENSVVIPNATIQDKLVDLIEGGAIRGENLFHSFEQFSIPDGGQVYFANPEGIDNILTRVTGNNISEIFGTLGVDGNANLFLLNPNGIIFGENAALDVNGSFFATTGDSYLFANGFAYSATNPEIPPLLTINIPVGIQMGADPAPIEVLGTGHNHSLNIVQTEVNIPELSRQPSATALKLAEQKTLGLIGAGLNLEGANLIAPNGRIELGSLGAGERVVLIPTQDGFTVDYATVNNFEDISLSQSAALDVSGDGAGNVQLQGKQIVLEESSAIVANTLGSQNGGEIKISASERLSLIGDAVAENFPTGIYHQVETNATGQGASVEIKTDSLLFQNSVVASNTWGRGNGGNIAITANDLLLKTTNFYSPTLADGDASNLSFTATNFQLLEGSNLVSSTVSRGQAGDINYRAENITIEGSSVNSDTYNIGNGGDINFNGDKLTISQSGFNSNTLSFDDATGNAGNINFNGGEIFLEQVGLGSFSNGTGNAGNINLNGDKLTIRQSGFNSHSLGSSTGNGGDVNFDGGEVFIEQISLGSATNGAGNAGDINFNGDKLTIRQITFGADSLDNATGNAGNINFNGGEVLVEEIGFSSFTKSAGNAGDINFNGDKLTIRQSGFNNNSDNATGDAGNINFSAREIFLEQVGFESSTNGAGNAGNINFNSDKLTIRQSGFGNNSLDNATGNAGNIGFNAEEILIEEANFGGATNSAGNAGNISFYGDKLTIRQSSFNSDSLGDATGNAGDIDFNAGEILLEEVEFGSATNGTGNGGNIYFDAENLNIYQSTFGSNVRGSGDGGAIKIKATGDFYLEESFFGTDNFGMGKTADISIEAKSIVLNDSGFGANTEGAADAGMVNIVAESIILNESRIDSEATERSTGNAGNIAITTQSLMLNEGSIGTEAKGASTGNGGRITIQADTITLKEQDNELLRSEIDSQSIGDSDSGGIKLTARELNVEGGIISVAKFGSGEAGKLEIEADSIDLSKQGSIFAVNGTGAMGNGSDVEIRANNLVLRDSSNLTVATGGEGKGGNLDLKVANIQVLDGSQISSSSVPEIGFTIGSEVVFLNEPSENLELVTPTLPEGTIYGDAGDITIESQNITVEGLDSEGNSSTIGAFSETNATAGSIKIDADILKVSDRGNISVSNLGNGNSGSLRDCS